MPNNHLDWVQVAAFYLPKKIILFTIGTITNNEINHPGLGFTIPYHGGDTAKATIYIYTKNNQGIPGEPMSPVVMSEFNNAISDIYKSASIQNQEAALLEKYGTGDPERGVDFLCAEFILRDHTNAHRTYLYLTGASGYFIKLRVSLRGTDDPNGIGRNFADYIAQCIRRVKIN